MRTFLLKDESYVSFIFVPLMYLHFVPLWIFIWFDPLVWFAYHLIFSLHLIIFSMSVIPLSTSTCSSHCSFMLEFSTTSACQQDISSSHGSIVQFSLLFKAISWSPFPCCLIGSFHELGSSISVSVLPFSYPWLVYFMYGKLLCTCIIFTSGAVFPGNKI